jgi:hypothetical protein
MDESREARREKVNSGDSETRACVSRGRLSLFSFQVLFDIIGSIVIDFQEWKVIIMTERRTLASLGAARALSSFLRFNMFELIVLTFLD